MQYPPCTLEPQLLLTPLLLLGWGAGGTVGRCLAPPGRSLPQLQHSGAQVVHGTSADLSLSNFKLAMQDGDCGGPIVDKK